MNLKFWQRKDKDDLSKDLSDFPAGGPSLGAQDPFSGLDPASQSFSHESSSGFGNSGFGNMPRMDSMEPAHSQMQPSSFGSSAPQIVSSGVNDNDSFRIIKELEVISSKMDALKAGIDSLSQRVANLERIAQGEVDEYKKRHWG